MKKEQQDCNLKWLGKFLPFLICAVFFLSPVAHAVDFDDFNQEISEDDKDTFDKILEPVMKVYSLVKYGASVIAVLVLLFAGINYMTSGADPKKREHSKNMAMYVVVGLLVIWAAPTVVNFIL